MIINIVKNPVYAGIISFNGYSGHTQLNDAHEALVDKKTFEICQDIINRRTSSLRFYMTQNKGHTLLNGVLLCECGLPLVAKTSTSYKMGKVFKYFYYKHTRLNERPNKGIFALKRECTASYRADKFDQTIIDAVKKIGSSPKAARKLIRLNNDQGELRKLEAHLNTLEQSEKAVQAKLGKLLKLYLRSDWDEKTLNIEKAAMEKDLRKNRQEQKEVRDKLALVNRQSITLEIIMEYFALLANFETELSFDDQRRIIQTIFPRIEVKRNGDMVATARIPVSFSNEDFLPACYLQVS